MMGEDTVPNIDLNPNDWIEVRRILRTFVPEYPVWAFGSRAGWTAKPYSDLDLAVVTDRPLSLQTAANLRSAFDESNLPIKVDIVDWATASDAFRKIIEAGKVLVLQPAQALTGWIFKRLIDCTVDGVLSYGIVQPGQHDKDGIPIIRVNNISTGELHLDDPMRVSPKIEANYRRTRLIGGEVLLTVVGTTGQSVVVPNALAGWNVARAVAVIRPNPEIGARWINICLQSKSVQQFLDERANTTVQKTLNLGDVKEVLIPIPPPNVKHAIESFAVALDDKIELNRRMNATLEAMARALFQSWFVDFDPVRAKLDGRKPVGLDEATAAHFPEHLEETTLGHTPQGWEVRSLDKIAHYLNGLALQKYPPRDGPTLPVIKIAQLRKGDSIGADRCNTDLPAEYVADDGDVLFSWSGSLEVELWCGGRGALNQHLFKVTSQEFPRWFYYLWTLYHLDEFRLIAAGKATTMGHIQRGHLTAAKVLIPPPALLRGMTRVMAPLLDRMIANRVQSRTLATLRDALLPKLLSGNLRVPNAENEIFAVSE